ncbi:MAG: MFS transporter [Chloroflexi bacterium]|nr:MFS transporter [Chloroflexota bacterium]
MREDANHTSRGMATFFTVWAGQFISVIGSNLTMFALGVWVYEQSEAVTPYALVWLAASLPQVLLAPVAGALVDRWDRRWVMILSDCGAGLSTLAIALLLFAGDLSTGPIYAAVLIAALFSVFQWPAYSAATTLLVPKEHYARASGMVEMAQGIGMLVAPLIAGLLMKLAGLKLVLLIDFTTFAFAVGTLLVVRFPQPTASAEGEKARKSLWRELIFGWSYVAARRGLLALLVLFAVNNLFTGIATAVVVPMLLAFTSEATLGTVMTLGSSGAIVGSIVIGVWGGPQRRVRGVMGFGVLFGLGMMLMGLRPSAVLITLALGLMMGCMPIISACSQAIWQSKVEPDVQGRVFAVRSMISSASLPVAYLVAGPLADVVFEPLLVDGGVLADSVGRVIGVGAGRGIGLLLMCMGAFLVASLGLAYLYPRLRLVEDELPDCVGAELVMGDAVPVTAG